MFQFLRGVALIAAMTLNYGVAFGQLHPPPTIEEIKATRETLVKGCMAKQFSPAAEQENKRMKAETLVYFCDCYADEFIAFMATPEAHNNRLLFADKSTTPFLQSKIDEFVQTCLQSSKRIQE